MRLICIPIEYKYTNATNKQVILKYKNNTLTYTILYLYIFEKVIKYLKILENEPIIYMYLLIFYCFMCIQIDV